MILVGLSGRGDKDVAQAQSAARMSRYAAMFDRPAAGEGAFGAFLMLGDPGPRNQRAAARRTSSKAAPTWSRSEFPSPIRSPTGR